LVLGRNLTFCKPNKKPEINKSQHKDLIINPPPPLFFSNLYFQRIFYISLPHQLLKVKKRCLSAFIKTKV